METNEIYEKLMSLRNRIEADTEAPLGDCEKGIIYSIAIEMGISPTAAGILVGDQVLAPISTPAELEPTSVLDPDGETVINLRYQDGEYLNGHTVYGNEAKLLEKIGLARYISGWGYYVDYKIVDKLGTTFAYQAAVDLAAPALAAKQAAKEDAEDALAAKFEQAKTTGKAVVIDSYMSDDCNEPDCGYDSVTVYAMPDGTTKTVRNHTY